MEVKITQLLVSEEKCPQNFLNHWTCPWTRQVKYYFEERQTSCSSKKVFFIKSQLAKEFLKTNQSADKFKEYLIKFKILRYLCDKKYIYTTTKW